MTPKQIVLSAMVPWLFSCSSGPATTGGPTAKVAAVTVSVDDLVAALKASRSPAAIAADRKVSPTASFKANLAALEKGNVVLAGQSFPGLINVIKAHETSILDFWSKYPTMGSYWDEVGYQPPTTVTAADVNKALAALHAGIYGSPAPTAQKPAALALLGNCFSNCGGTLDTPPPTNGQKGAAWVSDGTHTFPVTRAQMLWIHQDSSATTTDIHSRAGQVYDLVQQEAAAREAKDAADQARWEQEERDWEKANGWEGESGATEMEW